jgi:two-component sensor histidine kinase
LHTPLAVLDIARLLVSELVTNAVIHGRSSPRLDVGAAASGALYVGVGDDDSRYPVVQGDDDGSLGCRGLRLLELLASRWGVRDDPPGKVVWFELDAGAG